MPESSPNVRSIFDRALEIESEADRRAFLDEACPSPAIRAQVDGLLAAHAAAGSFLEAPPAAVTVDPGLTIDRPTERPGTQIGPYKLLQQIGEGGMGVVYMAEQLEPVKRRVALKIIKPGMDSRQVIARFEAERQALSLMDHPNIAKVLDAGTTENGRPYFVMELVKGQPITQYCDDKHLTPRQRLELLLPVCQAIQHAHQKGIIHRDIKPTNILVAEYDEQPVPKVIDFGVAKATSQPLTEKTMFTGLGQIVGTLEYMSPEQAKLNQLDIDTRSDIYSLGVLLYELLTGTTPLEHRRAKESGILEALRIIREDEVPTLSNRLDMTEELPAIAANRSTEPTKLTRLVRGELDWIVMKALEKDRSRRYETAGSLAKDLQRYLADDPVQACPPSLVYRLSKFARRNKRVLAATAVLGLALLVAVGGIAGSIGWMARHQEVRRTRVAGQLELILDEVKQRESEQEWSKALTAAQRAAALLTGGGGDALLQAQVAHVLADLNLVQQLEEIRLARAGQFLQGERDHAWADRAYAVAFRDAGMDVNRLTTHEAAKRLRSRPQVVVALAAALDDWARCRTQIGNDAGASSLWDVAMQADPDPWRSRVREALRKKEAESLARMAVSTDLLRQGPVTLCQLGRVLHISGKREQAVAILRHAQRQFPADFWTNHQLAEALESIAHMDKQRMEEALGCYRTALALRPRSHGARHGAGRALAGLGRMDEALAWYEKSIEIDPSDVRAHMEMGFVLFNLRRPDEAIDSFKKAIEIDPTNVRAHVDLGRFLDQQGKSDEAIVFYRKAIELGTASAAPYCSLGDFLRREGKLEEAIASWKTAARLDPKCVRAHRALGWHLATASDPRLRDPQAAVVHALSVLEVAPETPNDVSNLGVALLQAGDAKAAVRMLEKADQMWPGSDHYHRVFLATAYWQIGEKDKARQAFDEGAAWIDKNQPNNDELRRFRGEAEQLMKIKTD